MADEMCASVLMSQEAERLDSYRCWSDLVGPSGCRPAKLEQPRQPPPRFHNSETPNFTHERAPVPTVQHRTEYIETQEP
jgi:hypothetical protein